MSKRRSWKAYIHLNPDGCPIRWDDGNIVLEKTKKTAGYEDCVLTPVRITTIPSKRKGGRKNEQRNALETVY